MKPFLAPAIALALLGGVVCCPNAFAQPPDAAAGKQSKSPFACDRLALTAEQRKRHFEELGPALRARKKSVRELPDGFAFEFPADLATFQLVAEWAAGEHVCCPFFDIDLRLEREGGPLWLRLTGRDGVKQFIHAEGATWLKP
jgi:hypothetical protein